MSGADLHVTARARFGDFALEVAETFEAGVVTALFGPSGAGKTSLLRLIAGFARPNQGRIAFGEDVWFDKTARRRLPVHKRAVGVVFQDDRLFPNLTVAGNLHYAAKRAKDAPDRTLFDEVVGAFDLAPLVARRTTDLSGGERRRVAVARALLAQPALLLLDEPFTGLDAAQARTMLDAFDTVVRRREMTALLVSHQAEEVLRLCGRVAIMEAGRVTAHGPTGAALTAHGLNQSEDGFAILDGVVRSHERADALTVVAVAGGILHTPIERALEPGDPVRLRIDVRDVILARDRPQGLSVRNALPVRVTDIRHDGAGPFTTVHVETETGDRLGARITRAAARDLDLAPGVFVHALVKSAALDR